MRKRIEQRLRKRLRCLGRNEAIIVSTVRRQERKGVALIPALRAIILDPKPGWIARAAAARLLALADAQSAVGCLLDLFFSQTEKIDLWETALTIESLGDRSAVRLLAGALHDDNPHRRHAAARALGWIPNAGRRASKALIGALLDHSQPQPVREEAAESLAYSNCISAIAPLISALDEPDARIRFWAVFALGSIGRDCQPNAKPPPGVIEALERMLLDTDNGPPTWWPIRREALAMLGLMEPSYRARLKDEMRRVPSDSGSSAGDRRWAEGYGDMI